MIWETREPMDGSKARAAGAVGFQGVPGYLLHCIRTAAERERPAALKEGQTCSDPRALRRWVVLVQHHQHWHRQTQPSRPRERGRKKRSRADSVE